jgi:glycosyltransferase involved in cell wall biosynthesis
VTKDTGISERLQSMVIEVDPFDIDDMVSAVERLLVPEIYATYKQRIYGNTFSHSWNEIAQEFIDVYNTLR